METPEDEVTGPSQVVDPTAEHPPVGATHETLGQRATPPSTSVPYGEHHGRQSAQVPHTDYGIGPASSAPWYGGGQPPIGPPPATPGFAPDGNARRRRRSATVVGATAAGVLALSGVAGLIGYEIGAPATTAAVSSGSTTTPSAHSGFPFGGRSASGGSSPFPAQPSYGGSSGSSGDGSSTGSGPSDASSIASKVDSGLVDIDTTIDYGVAEGAGTGMVLTSDGEVLTNNHVIDGATSISVTDVATGKTYSASVVGYDDSKDVAVLQLNGASGLHTVTRGNSSKVADGEEVVGIGNAGGSGGTPSYAGGTVTGTDKPITATDSLTGTNESLTDMIETNADIQPGDSGGPLVNSAGDVIGMDTAGLSSGGTFQISGGSGSDAYAIPINVALSVANKIESGDASSTVHIGTTAFLGVEVESGSSSYGGGFGYPGSSGTGSSPSSSSGVAIAGVVSGSPAATAGLSDGDVITSVAGHSVSSQSGLQKVLVNDERPGESVTLQYTDTQGQQHTVTVVLASGPPA